MVLPEHAGVANAIGAVVGQVAMSATGTVTSQGAGQFVVHLQDGIHVFTDQDTALSHLETALATDASTKVSDAGVEEIRLTVTREIKEATVENQSMFIEATVRVTAQGRPRIAVG
jgi:hypothetical protein